MRAIWLAVVLAAAPLLSSQAATPPNPATAQVLDVRLIVPCQPGDPVLVLVGANEEFCLAKEKVFDGSGVVKVQRYPTLPKAIMEISAAAADRLYDATLDKAGERLGFVFNGRLIFAPTIYDPVKTKELQITLKNDPDDIDALVAAFPGTLAAQ